MNEKIKSALCWVGFAFFILSGMVFLTASISGIVFLILGVLLCQPRMRYLQKRGKKSNKVAFIILGIILLIIGFSSLPTTNVFNQNTPQDIKANTSISKENDNITIEQNISDVTEKIVEDEINETKVSLDEQTIVNPESTDISAAMKVHFIDVGQGDSILIESVGQYMLIDAGENNKGDIVVEYLKKQGVESLTYLIGTHPHSDHIGGLDTIIEAFDVKKIIMPNVSHTSQTFEDVLNAISSKGLKITKPFIGTKFSLGNASFTIIAPNGAGYSNLNNNSVGIKLVNGNNTFIMCGDAELEAEYDICDNGLDISADVLKLGHHGSDTATTEAILKAVNPSYAVISVGEGNQYGHPDNETLQKMIDRNIELFRTDLQGTIIATSDGENITFNTEPTTIQLAEVISTPKPTQEVTAVPIVEPVKEDTKEITVYVTRTGEKYHKDGCQYLRSSKIPMNLDEAIKSYEPCSKCNPPQ